MKLVLEYNTCSGPDSWLITVPIEYESKFQADYDFLCECAKIEVEMMEFINNKNVLRTYPNTDIKIFNQEFSWGDFMYQDECKISKKKIFHYDPPQISTLEEWWGNNLKKNIMTPKIQGKILCRITHGSRLYKMHGPGSDYDEKGIYLSDKEELYLMRAVKNYQWKETDKNKETEIFALTEFFKHAARGEGYAIDMLHCGDEDIIETSPLWEYLRENKSKFYTKDMVGLLGFAKTNAVKYCLKAERLNAVKSVLKILQLAESKGVMKLFQVWDEIPRDNLHIVFGEEERNNNADKRYVEIASKKFPATISPQYAVPILQNLINSYGDRTQKASDLDSKDVKSLSHSFRLSYQLLGIYKNGGFKYPLPNNDFLMAIKYRKLDYNLNKLDDILNDLIIEIEQLAEISQYPKKVDQKWLDEVVLSQYRENMGSI